MRIKVLVLSALLVVFYIFVKIMRYVSILTTSIKTINQIFCVRW